MLVLRLAELVEAVADLRRIQQRAAQTAAARAAAAPLYSMTRSLPRTWRGAYPRTAC